MIRFLALCSCALFLVACNDKATGVGSDIIPGTDTLYPVTSSSTGLITSAVGTETRVPIFNNTYGLLGKTNDSEARMFVEFIQWPTIFADTSPYRVIAADMQLVPAPYIYGDTTNKRISFNIYELQQTWSPTATWDSIWNADGSSAYYATSQPTMGTCDHDVVTADSSGFFIPLDTAVIHRWLRLASDTATRAQIKGMVLHPSATTSIRQIRALNAATIPLTTLRLQYQHRDSTHPDTVTILSATATFVNSPFTDSTLPVIQGARILQTKVGIDLSSLRQGALVMNGSLRLKLNVPGSTVGNTGITEVLRLNYTTFSGGQQAYFARYDSTANEYVFSNLAPALQDMARHQVPGSFVIRPDGVEEFWRMNRLSVMPWSADTATRPRLSLIYTVPKVIR